MLNTHSLKQLIDWYYEKYPKQILLISIPQALIYFADAEEGEDRFLAQRAKFGKP